jgi:hypothetical protein
MRILIVDDDAQSVEPLQQEIRKRFSTAQSMLVGFKDSERTIESFSPHIIVLDIMQGAVGDDNAAGLQTRDDIWERKFCPVIIYTARRDLVEDDAKRNHPFFRVEAKGGGSEVRVAEIINEYEPQVSALNGVGYEIQHVLNRALKEVAPTVFENIKDGEQRRDALTRFARRRVAAAMDETLSTGGPKLRSWEHYLCPPTSKHLLTGDILRKTGGNPKDPSSYRVVLTPSCDLVAEGQRHPNVETVLAATCSNAERVTSELGLSSSGRRDKWKERLVPLLRRGHGSSCLPVPALPGEFPTMTADFRRLELISLNQIGDDKEYTRVASVDNPFRELVAWAYVLNAARPAMPDRDFESWADEITAAVPVPEKESH